MSKRNAATTGTGAAIDLSLLSSRPIVIEQVRPAIDHGRFAVKRREGDTLTVTAAIFTEGHGALSAALKLRRAGATDWREAPMVSVNHGLALWEGTIPLDDIGRHEYTIEAWRDPWTSWTDEVGKKVGAGQDVALELLEGRALVEAAAARASGDDAVYLNTVIKGLDATDATQASKVALMTTPDVAQIMARWPDRSAAVEYDLILPLVVDPPRATFAAWYEMFPRSQGTEPGRWATFDDCIKRLPEIRAMGFDVLYFVPIHPIGVSFRKGKNNSLEAQPGEPGSPYAIGSAEGGHTAVHPELGTIEDFERLVRSANHIGMEVALDIAIQCSPDHPWVKEHPEWFKFRPDGTIKYAENPPKKYQDIVNVEFFGPHQYDLWEELRQVFLFWIHHGVTIFRVDNPHTKPVPFWEWVIRTVKDEYPHVQFLAEAFTRPPMMKMLAKVGYTQSYSYFTWRNSKAELTEYLTELTQTECVEYMQPNFFANTPDILPEFLQRGGRPAFMIRAVLAATLSTVYGIYNGFELCENDPIPGKEEYNNSEKYEFKVWDWERPGHIKDLLRRLNRIRLDNPALWRFETLRFYPCDNDDVLFYGKMSPDGDSLIFVLCTVNPFDGQHAWMQFPLAAMGIPEDQGFEVEDLLTGDKHLWTGAWHHYYLDPTINPAAIFRVTPWRPVDYRTPTA
ncbi:alpha-1,4-glucan--maltose-1-phosphate maltosyltransferase [Roseospira marina]|uniref:Alpha-1,4-glucan:maltose-1-phosphate maltosyltransferase n=1 Tax=Roseospira marina TaxID=140057 RepID=A0A5M6ID55_9PROT|nr:alpha-1,4-glucan--maltose-1-phosphate maltosyltransferase [Roseospira marina]KAA5606211.1 alpha-1,4-glucan--maltose-1-phosphate maltosyltransferase [Roseospira marina]MBB4314358.1 starch synthase (maltosyl-transferring) [Roseospira marina]MBB5087518.1 starch synthase (maltosyl-transferring) [Roseospira marina]